MEENILVRTLGDTHLLKVLGFFLEHPIHQFKITTLSKYLELSRETVKKDLVVYEDLGYIVRTSIRGPYRLRLSNDMAQTLVRCTTEMARTQLKAEDEIPTWGPSPYPERTFIPASASMMSIAGA
jgi:hypothetical protein